MTRECQVYFGSAITNAGRTWHAHGPDVSPHPVRGTRLAGFLVASGYSQTGFCWLSATRQGIIKPFASIAKYELLTWKTKFQLRHCLLRLAPFLKHIRLRFFPLGDLLLLESTWTVFGQFSSVLFFQFLHCCKMVSDVYFPKVAWRTDTLQGQNTCHILSASASNLLSSWNPSHVGNHLSFSRHHKALYIPCDCLPGKPKCPLAWNQLDESTALRAFVKLWCVLYACTSSNNFLFDVFTDECPCVKFPPMIRSPICF